MCVIVYQPAEKKLTKKVAEGLWRRNSDGGGFAFLNEDSWHTHKTMEFDDWWKSYREVLTELSPRPILIHMRIRTHGETDLNNVHPFEVSSGKYMAAHNGIIHYVPDYKDGRSDTRVFLEDTVPHFPDNWLDIPEMTDLVTEAIGWSKMVFMPHPSLGLEHTAYILNEKKGEWLDGMWFSNTAGHPTTRSSYTWTSGNNGKRQSQLPKGKQETYEPDLRTKYYDSRLADDPAYEPARALVTGMIIQGCYVKKGENSNPSTQKESSKSEATLRADALERESREGLDFGQYLPDGFNEYDTGIFVAGYVRLKTERGRKYLWQPLEAFGDDLIYCQKCWFQLKPDMANPWDVGMCECPEIVCLMHQQFLNECPLPSEGVDPCMNEANLRTIARLEDQLDAEETDLPKPKIKELAAAYDTWLSAIFAEEATLL